MPTPSTRSPADTVTALPNGVRGDGHAREYAAAPGYARAPQVRTCRLPMPSASPNTNAPADAVITLPNGVRVVTLSRPQVASASVSVYVGCGSVDEPRVLNGISHVVEHMVFKGTATRDARRINLDAERLGAEVDAHTDKDHTAFHLRGLAEHAEAFVPLLADLLRTPSFPEDEIERERQVLLHEFADDEDDPISTAFKLFDRACYGVHPAAWPVIGTRQTLERFDRADLAAWVAQHYGASRIVVGAAGAIDPDRFVRAVERHFGDAPDTAARVTAAPEFAGGLKSRRLSSGGQVQLVMGWPIPPLRDGDARSRLAAALFGEGMSSPLMHRLREERGLAYYAACSADVFDLCGQFVVEASTASGQVGDVVGETMALLRAQAARIEHDDFERAKRQLAVRLVRAGERPSRELEDAALDLFSLGRVRSLAERRAEIESIGAGELAGVFQRLATTPPAVALTGPVGRGVTERLREALAR